MIDKYLKDFIYSNTPECPYNLPITTTPATIPGSVDDWIDTCIQPLEKNVNHPEHYGGADNVYEAIKVIEAWDLGFCLGNTVKYISRAGKKDGNSYLQDLEKAKWYLEREIERVKND